MSEGAPHAMSCGENSSDYQAKKITALKDGLRNHDQCGVHERKAAGEREDDRYQKQQRDYQQEDFQPESVPTFVGIRPRPQAIAIERGARVHAAAAALAGGLPSSSTEASRQLNWRDDQAAGPAREPRLRITALPVPTSLGVPLIRCIRSHYARPRDALRL
jgi:hypothetical protein